MSEFIMSSVSVESSGKISVKINKVQKRKITPINLGEEPKKTKYVSKFLVDEAPVRQHYRYFCIDTPMDLPDIDDFVVKLAASSFPKDIITSYRFEKISTKKRVPGGYEEFFPRFHTEVRIKVTDDFDPQLFARSFFNDFHVEEFFLKPKYI